MTRPHGFDFGAPGIADNLTGTLEALKDYNGLRVHADSFAGAMDRLRDKYLNVPLDAVLHPVSLAARQAAKDQQAAAKSALSPFLALDTKQILQRWRVTQESPLTPQETGLTLDVPEGVYLDPETRLMWTIEDNGTSVNWRQAKKYARNCGSAGTLIGGCPPLKNWKSCTNQEDPVSCTGSERRSN